jgi:glycosyltransferase involved in cell wall biosynthesis
MFIHTPQIKEAICQQSHFLSDDDLHVVPDPVELPETRLSKETARDRLDINADGPVFLFFGKLRDDKGPQLLLEAISSTDRDATFVIAGPEGKVGQEEIEATADISRPTIDARIEFISNSEIQSYFFASDAVVLPYRQNYRGTSGILQRAAATGRPVIVTDVGEIGYLTNQNDLGYVVEPEAGALARQFETFDIQTVTERFQSAAHEYANRQSVERFVREVRNVYVGAVHSNIQ